MFLRLVYVSPSLESRPVIGQAHRKKKKSISPHQITHRSITHHTTQQAGEQAAATGSYMDDTMVLVIAGGTYYHARVLDHHPWRAADSNNE